MPSPRVLLVDDNEAFADLVRLWLKDGYDLTVTQSGGTALELLRDDPFDVVLVDIMMPGMSGIELLKEMRNDAELARLPVIVVTAYASLQTRQESLFLKPWLVLEKPFPAQTLKDALEAVVRTQENGGGPASRADRKELIEALMDELAHGGFELVEAADDRMPPPPRIHGCAADVVAYDKTREHLHFGIVETAASLDGPVARVRIRELTRMVMGEGASEGRPTPLTILVPDGDEPRIFGLLEEMGLSDRLLRDIFVVAHPIS